MAVNGLIGYPQTKSLWLKSDALPLELPSQAISANYQQTFRWLADYDNSIIYLFYVLDSALTVHMKFSSVSQYSLCAPQKPIPFLQVALSHQTLMTVCSARSNILHVMVTATLPAVDRVTPHHSTNRRLNAAHFDTNFHTPRQGHFYVFNNISCYRDEDPEWDHATTQYLTQLGDICLFSF